MTRTVADNALVLDAIGGLRPAGLHLGDTRGYIPMGRELNAGVKGLTHRPAASEFFGEGLAPAVKKQVLRCRQAAAGKAARAPQVTEVSIPSLDYALPAYYVISSAEASSNLARFDGVRYGYRAARLRRTWRSCT